MPNGRRLLWSAVVVGWAGSAWAAASSFQLNSSTPASQGLVAFQLDQAEEYLKEGKAKEAQVVFEQVMRSSPTAPGVLARTAEGELATGDVVGAEKSAKMILSLDKGNAEAWVFLARGAYARGEYGRVLKLCDRALRYQPHYSPAYFWRGKAFEAKGEPDEARNEYHAASLCNK